MLTISANTVIAPHQSDLRAIEGAFFEQPDIVHHFKKRQCIKNYSLILKLRLLDEETSESRQRRKSTVELLRLWHRSLVMTCRLSWTQLMNNAFGRVRAPPSLSC